MNQLTADEGTARILLTKYRKNPLGFFTEILGVPEDHIWEKMSEVAESVRDNKNTAVKAGHSVSKSFTASRLALWFLYCFNPCTVITTAPSHPQVEEILWREMRDAHAQAKVPLGGRVTRTQIELAEKWFAYGFATKPDTVTQQATRFQGFHNRYVLIVFDEAAGIMREIWEAKDSLMTAGHCRFLAIGNPTSAQGAFVECFKDKAFSKITISVKDTPNYKEGREVIPGLSGRDYEESTAEKYGRESNYYKARVLGEIPDEDSDALIPLSWVERAENRPAFKFPFKKRFVTWDVADGGDDKHVIKAWENKCEIDCQRLFSKKVEEAEPFVWRMLRKIGGNCIIVDADGVGRVAYELLRQAKDNAVKIIPFMGSSTDVYEPNIFSNRRHEGHWQMRKDFEMDEISIPEEAEQREELTAIKLVDDTRGFISIEKKKDLKERIGRSPDNSDSIMMMSAEFRNVKPIEKKPDAYSYTKKERNFNPMTV